MSVLIRGISMPTSCHVCVVEYGGCCYVAPSEEDGICPDSGRPDWCPLVPVPPHYDLIDHNALKIAVMDCDCETRMDFLKHTLNCINKAPVVIPSDMPTYEAEEGET